MNVAIKAVFYLCSFVGDSEFEFASKVLRIFVMRIKQQAFDVQPKIFPKSSFSSKKEPTIDMGNVSNWWSIYSRWSILLDLLHTTDIGKIFKQKSLISEL